jgi:hypothetical protein
MPLFCYHRRMASLYKDLVRARIPTDHHESDLYVLDTPEARKTINKYGYKFTTFTSDIDGKRWIDVPFAYEPFWEKKKRSHATVKSSLTARRNIDVQHPEYVSEGALRGFGRKAFHQGYTLEGAYTFAEAAVGRRLDEAELDAVATGWNAENLGRRQHATKKRSGSSRAK